jgi:hypothetical protein
VTDKLRSVFKPREAIEIVCPNEPVTSLSATVDFSQAPPAIGQMTKAIVL